MPRVPRNLKSNATMIFLVSHRIHLQLESMTIQIDHVTFLTFSGLHP